MPSKEVVTFWLDMTASMTLPSPVWAVTLHGFDPPQASHTASSAAGRLIVACATTWCVYWERMRPSSVAAGTTG